MAGNQENFDSKNTSTYNGTPESPPRVDTELGRRRHSSSPIPLVRRSHDESDADEEESKRDKKFVRFVDTLGLQLTSVKLFHHDELPNVPESAFNHLSLTSRTSSPPKQSDVLLPTFRQPGTLANFIVRLSEQKVLLESCQASAEDSVTVLSGEVKVVNVWFHKAVWVRYSYDGWASFAEIQATHKPDLHTGWTDTFLFRLPLLPRKDTRPPWDTLQFAIRYHTHGNIYWDNNYTHNYRLQLFH
ncbi:glycogen-binding subunit 76A-like [Folsomia candida]|uniref:glycogen-binding subunit 76A-like n=1 Tax=Folsomia candida TaxID=158441 RepID=UPI0016054595|nr:glycogen-binding subunit 76A-like [Folsomia candida]